jgi:hypothetical protein
MGAAGLTAAAVSDAMAAPAETIAGAAKPPSSCCMGNIFDFLHVKYTVYINSILMH